MIRFATLPITFLLASASLLTGCGGFPPSPAANNTPETDAFDNSAATQSIMQPKVIAESPPTPTPKPTPVEPPPLPHASILFAHGTSLDEAGRAALDRLAADPAMPSNATLILRGNTDSVGSDAANLVTSRKRALAVRAYLKKKGIAADRIEVIALGERRPVAPNAHLDGSDDPEARARNRRVDIEVVVAPAPPPAPVPAASPSRQQ